LKINNICIIKFVKRTIYRGYMNQYNQKDLHKSKKGHVIIKTKTGSISVLLENVINSSPYLEKISKKNSKDDIININLSTYSEYAIDLILRYMSFGFNFFEDTLNKELLKENICDIISLFNFFEINEEKSCYLIKYLEEENIDDLDIKTLNERLKRFDLNDKLFELMRMKYCDYIIKRLKINSDKKIYNIYSSENKHDSSKKDYSSKKQNKRKLDNVYTNHCCPHKIKINYDTYNEIIKELSEKNHIYILKKLYYEKICVCN